MTNPNILVIGEYGIDIFKECSVSRLAPEVPVPVCIPIKTTTNPGLAANVVENIRSLRPTWKSIYHITNITKITKTRYIDAVSGHWFLRVDENDELPKEEMLTIDGFKAVYGDRNHLKQFNAVVVSDYCKGLISVRFLDWLIAECHPINVPTFVDTKKCFGTFAPPFCGKINEKEYLQSKIHNPELHAHNFIKTMGKDGAVLWQNKQSPSFIKTRNVEVSCQSGAGDSFLASLVCCYLETYDLTKAVEYANIVAGIAVSKRNVVAVTQEEVLAVLNSENKQSQ